MAEDSQDDARRLANESRCSVILPAGGGKTELIARAVGFAREMSKRQLVLTHTHAGVAAIRSRLRRLRVPTRSFRVQTLDGFALQYASHYPILASYDGRQPDDNDSWSRFRDGAIEMFGSGHLRRVLQATYAGVFVDEYQDCSRLQHQLVLQIADALPTRVLGDPLQGVFEFDDIVDWQLDVEPLFPILEVTETPWRWKKSNPLLGEDLQDLRTRLLAGEPIDFRDYRQIQYRELSPQEQISACHDAADSFASVVAIHEWASQCHKISRKLRGRFSSMEELESRDLKNVCRRLETTNGAARAVALIDFSKLCLARLPSTILDARRLFLEGKKPRTTSTRKNAEVFKCLVGTSERSDWHIVLETLKLLEAIPSVFVSRRECWSALKRTLRVALTEPSVGDLSEAARLVKERTRHMGRRAEQMTVSRVLLVKGLEYHQSIVLDADQLGNAKELYVALTRGSHALTVLSKKPVICFPAPRGSPKRGSR